ncbi:MAG TPA: ATP-binding protein, partial [Methanomicrobiales archaeon]|nr:ATP-binding protein [Methanomicrobiales archaeon]
PEKDEYTGMRRMIFLCMILVPVIPFIAVLGIGYYHFTTSLETNTLATMSRIVEDHRQMIDTFLRERRRDLGFILDTNTYESLTDPEKFYAVFTQLQRNSNAFVDLGVFDQEGIHVMYQGPYRLVGIDYGKEEWFRHVLKEGYYISDIFLGFRRIPHFVIALKKEESGKTWVIRATIDTYLFNELVEKVRIGKTGEAYILNAQGIFQTSRRSGGNLLTKDPDDISDTNRQPGVRTFIRKDARGDECLFATTWLREKQWMLVVRQETADAFKALRSATFMILVIMVLGGVTITILAYTLTRQIIRRMQRIDVEKQQLGQQLVRATRLAELGQMAAGFAHEINNPLQIMKSDRTLIEMIVSDLKKKGTLEEQDRKDLGESLDQLKVQIERCAKITQTILEFGRKNEPEEKDVDVGAFISQVTSMISEKASVQGIRVKKEISEQTPVLRADPSQLQQVLLNLLNNAIDAITERHASEGGELSIQAGPDTNGRVRISVRDNGIGISAENLKKIFTPFFTTKPPGKGTGLGLYVCYGIIEGMGGTMEVESQ